jgi:hypothetical protein
MFSLHLLQLAAFLAMSTVLKTIWPFTTVARNRLSDMTDDMTAQLLILTTGPLYIVEVGTPKKNARGCGMEVFSPQALFLVTRNSVLHPGHDVSMVFLISTNHPHCTHLFPCLG